jgi:hypothetical protein
MHLTDEQRDDLLGRIQAALGELSMHFEVVQILAQKEEGDVISHFSVGKGNVFARIGHAYDFASNQSDLEGDDDGD